MHVITVFVGHHNIAAMAIDRTCVLAMTAHGHHRVLRKLGVTGRRAFPECRYVSGRPQLLMEVSHIVRC